MLLMANYYLARGGFCVGDINYRYRPPCVGSFGITLKDYANQTGGSPPDDDVRVAAQAAVDAGIPPDVLGVNGGGELVGLAAHRNNAGVVSILITFGFDPSGRGGTSGRVDWTALHHAAIEAEDNAPGGLSLLRHFIGGLQGAALLESFSDWNPDSNQGRPLDILQSGASANTLNLDAKLEMHSLLYELGATCASDTDDYCGVPAEDLSASEVSGLGGVFTITARMFSDFAGDIGFGVGGVGFAGKRMGLDAGFGCGAGGVGFDAHPRGGSVGHGRGFHRGADQPVSRTSKPLGAGVGGAGGGCGRLRTSDFRRALRGTIRKRRGLLRDMSTRPTRRASPCQSSRRHWDTRRLSAF